MKNKALFMAFFLAISITNLVSAATWWDSTDVRRTEDGCIEYSLKVEEAINKNNGDIFSGVVVQKFGHFRPCTYSSNTNKVSKSYFDHRQNKVVALKGIINGKNISNISLYKDVHVKYIAHRNDKRCKSNHIYNGEKTKVDERYHPIVKKNGVEIAKICKCPIEIVVEREPVLTAENKFVWEMMAALDSPLQKIDLSYDHVKLDETVTTYLSPNMYNGTYLVNGEVRVIDIHTLKTKTRTVKMYPLISVYENSAVFEIDGADSGNGCYNIYKSDGIYKVQKYTISVIHDNYKSYIKPTDELIDYAETVARILGINLDH